MTGPMTITEAIEKFLEHLRMGNPNSHTARTYQVVLRRFCEFLRTSTESPISPANPAQRLSAQLAIDFIPWMTVTYWLVDRKGQPRDKVPKTTVQVYIAAVSRFYSWLTAEGCLNGISAMDYERMRVRYKEFRAGHYSRLPKLPEPGAVQEIIQAARNVLVAENETRNLLRLRNIAILEVLRCTGMRVGELVSLNCGDLVAADRSASVIGKENKERSVFFDERAWASLMQYLQTRGYEDSQPIFASHSRRAKGKITRLTTRTIEHVFARCLALTGVQQKLTPHSFRHHFATKLLNETGDLALVQIMMGHASPKTTMIYVTVSKERMIQAHRQTFETAEGG